MRSHSQAAAFRAQQQAHVAHAMQAHAQSQYLHNAAQAGRLHELDRHPHTFGQVLPPSAKRPRHVATMDMGDAMFDGWVDASMGRDVGRDTALDAAFESSFDGQVRGLRACAQRPAANLRRPLPRRCQLQDLFTSELFASMGVDDGDGRSDYLGGDMGFGIQDMNMSSVRSAGSHSSGGLAQRGARKSVVTATASGYKAVKAERRAARPKRGRGKANGCVHCLGACLGAG